MQEEPPVLGVLSAVRKQADIIRDSPPEADGNKYRDLQLDDTQSMRDL